MKMLESRTLQAEFSEMLGVLAPTELESNEMLLKKTLKVVRLLNCVSPRQVPRRVLTKEETQ